MFLFGFLFNFHDEEAFHQFGVTFPTVSTLLLSGTDQRRPQKKKKKNELNSVNNIVPVSAVASHTSSLTDL